MPLPDLATTTPTPSPVSARRAIPSPVSASIPSWVSMPLPDLATVSALLFRTAALPAAPSSESHESFALPSRTANATTLCAMRARVHSMQNGKAKRTPGAIGPECQLAARASSSNGGSPVAAPRAALRVVSHVMACVTPSAATRVAASVAMRVASRLPDAP